MSITQGMTGGGSWSGRRTLRAFPTGAGYRSLGRGNLQLLPGISNTELLVSLALLPLAGPAAGVARGVAFRALNIATKPVFWFGVNVYQEAQDLRSWVGGEDMSWQLDTKIRPFRHPVFGSWGPGIPAIPVPFPYIDFTKTPSSGVGGPGEFPNLHRPPLSMKETGEILSNPPTEGEVPSSPRSSTSKKAGQCPYYLREIRAGRKYWQKGRKVGKHLISKHDRCAKRAGHSGRHSFSGPFHSKGNITSYLKRLHG